MKKFSFATLVFVGLMLTTGCKKEPSPTPAPEPTPTIIEPTLTLVTEPNITEGAEVEAGTTIKFTYICEGENLSSLTLNITGENGEETVLNGLHALNGGTSDTVSMEKTFSYIGRITLEAVLRANERTASVTLHFTSVAPPEPEPIQLGGLYEGYTKLEGSVTALGMTHPVNDSTQVAMTIAEAGDAQIDAVFVYNGTTYELTGSQEGNSVVFDPFSFEINSPDVQLTATIQLNGTLEDDVLSLDGSLSNCVLNYNGIAIPVVFDGGISGILTKSER